MGNNCSDCCFNYLETQNNPLKEEMKNLKERVSLPVAARELGCSPQAVREHMRAGLWDLGEVIPPEKRGKTTWAYYIFRPKLDVFLGRR